MMDTSFTREGRFWITGFSKLFDGRDGRQVRGRSLHVGNRASAERGFCKAALYCDN